MIKQKHNIRFFPQWDQGGIILKKWHSWTHSHPPPTLPSLIKGGGQDLPKIESLGGGGGGGTKFFARKGSKPEKERSWCRNRGLPLFYYFTVQSHLLFVWESKVPFITFWIFSILRFNLAIQDSHPCLYCTKTWYHL